MSKSESLSKTRHFVVAALVLAACQGGVAYAMTASPFPFDVTQPDGTTVTLYIRGNEYFHWLEDVNGYTVVRQVDTFLYAKLDSNQQLAPTQWMVGKVDPKAAGLTKRLLPPPGVIQQNVAAVEGAQGDSMGGVAASPAGSRKNVVILMRWADHLNRTLPSPADYGVFFNAVGGDPVLAPTGSIRDVYLENSYGAFAIDSTVFGWVDMPETEAWYADGVSGLGYRLRQGIRQALDLLDPVIDFSQFDDDGDGWVDAIAFIHSGYGAEWGGFQSPNRIWSHRSTIPTWYSAEGVRVGPYHISTGLWGSGGGSSITHIGVVAHETGHFFGLPDLYDTSGGGEGIGSYGLMANSWGFDGSQLYPPHFSAFSKIFLGWMTPTVITPGSYTIDAAELFPEVYRIDQGFPGGEYLLIENRQPLGLESIMPQGGLCIWHIDENKCCNTDEGYPGQAGWPENNEHYRVALLQADGRYDLERGNNRGDGGDVYYRQGVSMLGPDTVPNTDSYRSGTIIPTGTVIRGVSGAGTQMSFTYEAAPPDPPLPVFPDDHTNRYLRFIVPDSGGAEAFVRVTPIAIDGLVGPLPAALYVGEPVDAPDENSALPGLTFKAAPLSCEPFAADWSAYGAVAVYGTEIVPGSTYEIALADANCPATVDESCWSDPLTITTTVFGDVAAPFAGTGTQPDFGDIQSLVGKFLSSEDSPFKAACQLQPSVVNPQAPLDFRDIDAGVSAFLGTSFDAAVGFIGGCTCPSSVTCGATSCSSAAQCPGGTCINGSCADACGRCAP